MPSWKMSRKTASPRPRTHAGSTCWTAMFSEDITVIIANPPDSMNGMMASMLGLVPTASSVAA